MKQSGLTQLEATELLAIHGLNQIEPETKRSFLQQLFGVLKEPMLLLLLAAGTVNFILAEPLDGWMLLFMVTFVIGVTVIQERRTENAVAALRNLTAPLALVIRDGVTQRISSVDLVPGDIILVAEGDRVPADAVLLSREICELDESTLTGESVPVQRWGDGTQLAEIFAGTMVARGHGIARVANTGKNTRLGQIGSALATVRSERTQLQREIDSLVKLIAVIGILAAVAVTAIYGLTRGNFIEGLLAGIATAMAMLPEEFPVVLTVFLAFGTWRMAKKNVLVRKPAVVEALGSVSTICADKTGTITQNRMQVVALNVSGKHIELEQQPKLQQLDKSSLELLRVAAAACPSVNFDPTDLAIRELAEHFIPDLRIDKDNPPRVLRSYPMQPEFPAMAQVFAGEVAAKGAPEALAKACGLSKVELQLLEKQILREAASGNRVIGVATAQLPQSSASSIEKLPGNLAKLPLRFLGLLCLRDPVRPGVREAIQESQQAGIRTIMITGDYPETALAIAADIGLETSSGAITGKQLAKLDDAELASRVSEVSVFARMIPEQKLRLVRALQANGEVVAMTGDGVNDGPALKAADVGIAMGKRGTEVAREAAHMVLTDDDFSSIVRGVRAGRGVYQNLQKALSYVIAIHIPMLGMAILPVTNPMWPLIMLPVLVAFLELVIDPACSIAFESEPADSDIMQRRPRKPKQRMFALRNLAIPLAQGLALLVAVVLVYFATINLGLAEETVRSIAFATLMAGNLTLILVNRSWNLPLWQLKREHRNPKIYWILIGASLLLVSLLALEPLRNAFRMGALDLGQFLIAMGLGIISVLWFELIKAFRFRKLREPTAVPKRAAETARQEV